MFVGHVLTSALEMSYVFLVKSFIFLLGGNREVLEACPRVLMHFALVEVP